MRILQHTTVNARDRRNRDYDTHLSPASIRSLFNDRVGLTFQVKQCDFRARIFSLSLRMSRRPDVEFLQTGTSTFRIPRPLATLETRARASIHVISASQRRRRTPLPLSQARCAISTPRFNEVHQSFDPPLLRRSLNISRRGGGGSRRRPVRTRASVFKRRSSTIFLHIKPRLCISR